jgi:hypothetical protein
MLTISRLSRWSINYYSDTARQAAQAGLDRRRANGGTGGVLLPTWLVAGDPGRTVELVGLDGRAADAVRPILTSGCAGSMTGSHPTGRPDAACRWQRARIRFDLRRADLVRKFQPTRPKISFAARGQPIRTASAARL